jgi:hypothetical protein
LNDKELGKLDPKKRIVNKIFRKHKENDTIINPVKRQVDVNIEKKEFKIKKNYSVIFKKSIFFFAFFVLSIGIISVLFFYIKMITPSVSFVDTVDNSNMKGYIYLDDKFIGQNNEANFDKLPITFCFSKHVIRLESDSKAYEWETEKKDCKTKNLIFYVEHQKASPSKNIVFEFLDRTDSYYLSGKLFFDDVYIKDINNVLPISREKCKTLSKIRLEYENGEDEWDNEIDKCDKYNKIKFKTPLR